MRKSFIFVFTMAVVLVGCSSEPAKPLKEEEHAPEEAHQLTVVSFSGIQMKTAGIEIGTIESKNLKSSLRANGMLSVPNQNKAFVTSVSSGVIKSLFIHPGNVVRKGQVVAIIANPDVAALQQQLQIVNAQLTLAEIEYNRQKELVEGNAAPLKNVQRVQAELATLRASQNSLQKQLGAMGISVARVNKGEIVTTLSVTAPIGGTVSNVTAQIGSAVDVSTPLAEIVNNSQLHLDLFVYEKDLPSLHADQIIHFTLTNNPGREYDALIYSIGTAFANESKTIAIHAIVKGDKTGLIEGMNITALISIGSAVLPAVPTDAIVNYQGQDYIFVEAEPDSTGKNEEVAEGQDNFRFQRVPVVRGVSDVGYTEITLLNSLPADSKIITKGAFFALAKMTNIEGHEH